MFSKYDVYTTVQSMYCYPDIHWGNTDRETLINAAIAAVDDDMAFCDVLRQCVETKN